MPSPSSGADPDELMQCAREAHDARSRAIVFRLDVATRFAACIQRCVMRRSAGSFKDRTIVTGTERLIFFSRRAATSYAVISYKSEVPSMDTLEQQLTDCFHAVSTRRLTLSRLTAEVTLLTLLG
jgi:hypothetical protein